MTGHELMEEVKRRYPPGTQFIDANRYHDIQTIPENPNFNCTLSDEDLGDEVDEDYDAVDEQSLEGYVYYEGIWATIVKKTHELW